MFSPPSRAFYKYPPCFRAEILSVGFSMEGYLVVVSSPPPPSLLGLPPPTSSVARNNLLAGICCLRSNIPCSSLSLHTTFFTDEKVAKAICKGFSRPFYLGAPSATSLRIACNSPPSGCYSLKLTVAQPGLIQPTGESVINPSLT